MKNYCSVIWIANEKALVYPTNRIGKRTPYKHTACALHHPSCLSKITSFLFQDVQRTYNMYINPCLFPSRA